MASLASWQNFYVIVGSAAAALTGLMFVVITLIAGTRGNHKEGAMNAFNTPTLIHFCAARDVHRRTIRGSLQGISVECMYVHVGKDEGGSEEQLYHWPLGDSGIRAAAWSERMRGALICRAQSSRANLVAGAQRVVA